MTLRELMLKLGALPSRALDDEVRLFAALDGEYARNYEVYEIRYEYYLPERVWLVVIQGIEA